MVITDAHAADVVERVSRDLRSSGLPGYVRQVQAEAATRREYEYDNPSEYIERVVEEVQNYILDGLVTWPVCPQHPHHPLWYHDDGWFCDQDRHFVARLGELMSLQHS
jgi:hypothetical protein